MHVSLHFRTKTKSITSGKEGIIHRIGERLVRRPLRMYSAASVQIVKEMQNVEILGHRRHIISSSSYNVVTNRSCTTSEPASHSCHLCLFYSAVVVLYVLIIYVNLHISINESIHSEINKNK